MPKPLLLVTGGSGMVGRNLLEHPMIREWDVIAPSSSELDLCLSDKTQKFLEKHKPDAVIHAAGHVGGIHANIANPVLFLEKNLVIGRNIIMSCLHTGVKHFLNLASTCMYPRNASNPLSEQMILKGELEPTNEGYALAKIAATRLCQYIRLEHPHLHYKTLIPCNLFGRYDKFDPTASHLLPAIIMKIHTAKKENLDTVEIWGNGTARREFMYAGDFADAVLLALADIRSIPDLMNCGIGSDYTINEYYKNVADVVGWSGEFVHNHDKPTGMHQKLSDISLQQNWGWKAQTSLNDGIRKTYEFFKSEDLK